MDIMDIKLVDIYKNTIQTIIDIINEISIITSNYNYKTVYNDIYKIIFKKDRLVYIGIILIFLSFVIYFIDGATI
jgi:hypothetical protein